MIVSSIISLIIYGILITFFNNKIGCYVYKWKMEYLYLSAIISSICVLPFLFIKYMLRCFWPK